jgi:indolepyruvate ferredoxin oxidoreductase
MLAMGKHLRGSWLDPFGHTHERRMERALIDQYLQLLDEVLPQARQYPIDILTALLSLPMSMRGFGHVKERQVRAARQRQAALLHRLDPKRYPVPRTQLADIPVVRATPA